MDSAIRVTPAAVAHTRSLERGALTFLSMVVVCALTVGCSATRKDALAVHDSKRGSVYLEQQPTNVLHANHPARADAALVARVLSGLRVEEDRIFEDMGIGRGRRRPFSDDDVTFLTPLIVDALSRANPDQMVGFRVMQPTGDGFKTTEGVLWIADRNLHVALTKYQVDVARRPMVYRQAHGAQDATGLKWRVVTFIPEGLAETTVRPDLPVIASPYMRTLVIDTDYLAKVPPGARRVQDVRRTRPVTPPTTTRTRPAAPPPPAPEEVETEPHEPAPPPAVETKPARPAAPPPETRPSRSAPAPAETKPAGRAPASAPARTETPEEVIRRQDREIEALKERMRVLEERLEKQGSEKAE